MKKLLDELQSLKAEYNPQKYTADADIVFGIDKAIIAVRAHNPWHEVGELPPIRTDNYVSKGTLSVRVMLYDANENRHEIGYYYFDESRWCNFGQLGICPTHWAYLQGCKP